MLGSGTPHALLDTLWAWLSTRHSVIEAFAKTLYKIVQEELDGPMLNLQKVIDDFNCESAPKVAAQVKKKQTELEVKLDDISPLFKSMGLTLETIGEAQKVVQKSMVKTVHWGIHTLLNHKDIARLEEGQKGRQHLKAILDSFSAIVQDKDSIPEDLVAEASKILEMDNETQGKAMQVDAEQGGTNTSESAELKQGNPKRIRRSTKVQDARPASGAADGNDLN